MEVHPDAPKVRLYSKPGCGRCIVTARDFEKRGIPFEKIDITVDPIGYARVKELGYAALPVVEVGDMHWTDFQAAKNTRLAELLAAWQPHDGDELARQFIDEGGATFEDGAVVLESGEVIDLENEVAR
ncbi:glutaredoxin electron transport component of NRDEF [Mycobacteroides abscessus subsp. abscessus]|nr:glutaredoxin electron transport component of NRDEF [Mycobacteroides abscessus subsp. abscessus]